MKKIIVSMLFLLPLTALADDYGMRVPEWKDFAPSAFVDVEEPKGLGKFNVTAKYWYERKTKFEDALVNCQALASYEDRFSCYEELKVNQFKENTDYNARIEAKQNITGGIPEMQNRTDTMLPINNYINTFSNYMPNEFR